MSKDADSLWELCRGQIQRLRNLTTEGFIFRMVKKCKELTNIK